MTYRVHSIFATLQGEGAHVGRAAVFCRFSGCNLWSGRESDRTSAACRFCDTDFRGVTGPGGGAFPTADELADRILGAWKPDPADTSPAFVVLTGGEPAIQLDAALVSALHRRHATAAIETNGTLPLPDELDWVCVSPKAGTSLAVRKGDELKLVFPQPQLGPECLDELEFTHRWLQPMDGPAQRSNTDAAIAYCLTHPRWRLSAQTHKFLGIP